MKKYKLIGKYYWDKENECGGIITNVKKQGKNIFYIIRELYDDRAFMDIYYTEEQIKEKFEVRD